MQHEKMRSSLFRLVVLLAFQASADCVLVTPKAAWPSSLARHVSSGIVRTVGEAINEDGVLQGLWTVGKVARLVFDELIFFPLTMIPFACRTLMYRRQAMREVRCGPEKHQVLEVYEGEGDGPLVLYVHGGSWGQGAPWNYALLARRLLDQGASRVAIARYRLFPEADVDEMVDDIANALSWCETQSRAATKAGAFARLLGV